MKSGQSLKFARGTGNIPPHFQRTSTRCFNALTLDLAHSEHCGPRQRFTLVYKRNRIVIRPPLGSTTATHQRRGFCMKRHEGFVVLTGLLILATGWILAEDMPTSTATTSAKTTARAKDEQAIKAASQALASAFEEGDAKAVAALFTEQAEYLDEGSEPIQGRAALSKAYEGFFAKRKELQAESRSDSIRFLGADAAIEEGTFTVTVKDVAPHASRFTALYVREGGNWLIGQLKEWNDESTRRTSLEDLAWLIGSWEADSPDVVARTTYSWTANKSFIRVDYTITAKKPVPAKDREQDEDSEPVSKKPVDKEEPAKTGPLSTSGVQVIGIDPAVGLIRTWLFDAEGGIGESNWVWDGDKWVIESVGTLPDGTETKSMNFLQGSGDSFTWKSVKRTVGGEALPDIAPVKVKRVAAGK